VATVKSFGIKPSRTAWKSPWQNGVAERWVGSVRRELLDHVVVLGERHLRRLLRDYVAYYLMTGRTWPREGDSRRETGGAAARRRRRHRGAVAGRRPASPVRVARGGVAARHSPTPRPHAEDRPPGSLSASSSTAATIDWRGKRDARRITPMKACAGTRPSPLGPPSAAGPHPASPDRIFGEAEDPVPHPDDVWQQAAASTRRKLWA